MEEYNDKTQTFTFESIQEKKDVEQRSENDIYSLPRATYDEEKREEKSQGLSEGALIGIIAALVILFIAAVIAGIMLLKKPVGEEKIPIEDAAPPVSALQEEEEEVEEEVPLTACYIVFDSASVEKDGSVYTVWADVYDGSTKIYGKRLVMNSDTTISESGEALRLKSFIGIIESLEGNNFRFNARIDEQNNVIKSVSYNKADIDEILNVQEETQEPQEPQPPQNTEETETETETEEENVPSEGIVQ